jgi:hypothetical protein
MTTLFIAWSQVSKRSEQLAQQLGAQLHFIPPGRRRRTLNAPLRYGAQTLATWRILRAEQPDIIFVQNPPIVCALVVYLYARRHAATYALDSHSGAFVSPKWRWSARLHRFLARNAQVNIVHNASIAAFIKPWGCPYLVIGIIPFDYPHTGTFTFSGDFTIAVVNTFTADEPLETIFAAAEQLADVDFYVTGNAARIDPTLRAKKPSNCHLTGFLDYPDYIALLRGAHVVMDLTTQNHTVLMGGFEAIGLGKPLITSDWPVLVEYFSLGTIHVPNTAEGICAGVRQAQHDLPALEQGAVQLRDQADRDWAESFARLQAAIR